MKSLAIMLALLLSVGTAFAATLILQPGPSDGKDSHIRAGAANENRGTYSQLTVNWYPYQANRGIVEFDLKTLSGATINSAYIDLYNRANSPRDNFGIYRVLASWQEMVVTWGNQPAHFATAYAKVNVPSTGTFRFDVKKLVQEWADGTYVNYGFILKRDNEGGTSWPYFCSSDHSTTTWRPKITVDYTPSAITPASVGRVKALFR